MMNGQKHSREDGLSRIMGVYLRAAGTFAEAVMIPVPVSGERRNVFGRSIGSVHGRSLARILGSGLSGLRSSALIEEQDLEDNLGTLKQFARLHVPLTLVVTGDSFRFLPHLEMSGSMVFRASTFQELSDRILAAQVISEKALAPVVILCGEFQMGENIDLPSADKLREWFGDPDRRVPEPTPGQEMVLGKERKRMPSWVHLDMPVSIGAGRNKKFRDLERASNLEFGKVHWQSIIDQTHEEIHKFTGRTLNAYRQIGERKIRNLIIATSFNASEVDHLFEKDLIRKHSIGFIDVHQLFPVILPEVNWKRLDGLMIAEPAIDRPEQGWLFNKILPKVSPTPPKILNGIYSGITLSGNWANCVEAIVFKEASQQFWIDTRMYVRKCGFPKAAVMFQRLQAGYGQIEDRSLLDPQDPEVPVLAIASPGPLVRRFSNKGAPYSRLDLFYNSTSLPLKKIPSLVVADPFRAYPVDPPLSALLRTERPERIPVFDEKACTGCLDCLPTCPYGALPASLQTWESLIKAGIQQARGAGSPIAQIVPTLKNWAKISATVALEKDFKRKSASEILEEAFTRVQKAMKAEGEKEKTLRAEKEAIISSLGEPRMARTGSLFEEREMDKSGSGVLFTLAADPASCTGCGICVEVCPEDALIWREDLDLAEKDLNNFEALPEPEVALVEALKEEGVIDGLSSVLLRPSYYRAMVGAVGTDRPSPERGMLRVAQAMMKEKRENSREGWVKAINGRHAALKNTIKKILADALPTARLESLSEVLKEHAEDKLSMDRILGEWGQEESFQMVDRSSLNRKLELSSSLANLKWVIEEGSSGIGRASFSVVVDDRLLNEKEDEGIWNAFEVPVAYAHARDLPSVVSGVFEGQLRHSLDNIRLLRRASLEGTQKYDPHQHDLEIAGLSWQDLTEEERALIAPVLVFVDDRGLASNEWIEVLRSGYPIHVISIVREENHPAKAQGDLQRRNHTGWMHVASNAYPVIQSSLHDAEHLFGSLQSVLSASGGSLARLWVPYPSEVMVHSSRIMTLYPLAWSSRSWIPFRFTPGGKTIFSGMDIDSRDLEWTKTQLTYMDQEEEKEMQYTLTWADWAYLLRPWQAFFEPTEEDNVLQVADYLALSGDDRQKFIPVVCRIGEGRVLQCLSVAPEVIKICEQVLKDLELYRQWSGTTVEFPEKVRELVRNELEEEFSDRERELKKDLDREKMEWESSFKTELRQQIKERLMKMSGQE
ncbi:MAG: 4Fe-4S binding protein [Bacteroidota bacterium]|nr:4Fe-4S binding protein [Bacteroidota bacterium]MDX5505846.1 4Fe-4S binding protein [Bacteroidota bacterium]